MKSWAGGGPPSEKMGALGGLRTAITAAQVSQPYMNVRSGTRARRQCRKASRCPWSLA